MSYGLFMNYSHQILNIRIQIPSEYSYKSFFKISATPKD